MTVYLNRELLKSAIRKIFRFGNKKRYRWYFWEIDSYETMANKTTQQQLEEEIRRYNDSFILIRAIKRLFTPIASKRALLAYMEIRDHFAEFLTPVSLELPSFDQTLNFLNLQKNKLSYFSSPRSLLQRLIQFFTQRRSIEEAKKPMLRNQNQEYLDKTSDLYQQLTTTLSDNQKYDKKTIITSYKQWKKLAIDHIEYLKTLQKGKINGKRIQRYTEYYIHCKKRLKKLLLKAKLISIDERQAVFPEISISSVTKASPDSREHFVCSDSKQIALPIDLAEELSETSDKKNEVIPSITLSNCLEKAIEAITNLQEILNEKSSLKSSLKFFQAEEKKTINTFMTQFKKLFMACHPDKVADNERELAEIRFKIIDSQYKSIQPAVAAISEKNLSRDDFLKVLSSCLADLQNHIEGVVLKERDHPVPAGDATFRAHVEKMNKHQEELARRIQEEIAKQQELERQIEETNRRVRQEAEKWREINERWREIAKQAEEEIRRKIKDDVRKQKEITDRPQKEFEKQQEADKKPEEEKIIKEQEKDGLPDKVINKKDVEDQKPSQKLDEDEAALKLKKIEEELEKREAAQVQAEEARKQAEAKIEADRAEDRAEREMFMQMMCQFSQQMSQMRISFPPQPFAFSAAVEAKQMDAEKSATPVASSSPVHIVNAPMSLAGNVEVEPLAEVKQLNGERPVIPPLSPAILSFKMFSPKSASPLCVVEASAFLPNDSDRIAVESDTEHKYSDIGMSHN